MAAGDKAAAKGWTTYPATQPRRLGYQNDNEVLDRLADEEDARLAQGNRVRVQKGDPGNVPEGTLWVSWN